ncbi:two-component sensor histidine kinase [Campylobacter fetus subsp. testudinum]|uniref:sensor histidine kinase n=1 Tax=Campylobacter fetus TaxID=196 RepID=UPI00081884B1|nr:HAMP domain-containing sensor histidine kinase [Campylobacter fetus]AVK81494.1 sensor histidine kinase [Campylobacter fetus subsp. testudinum]OCR99599.1 two-component sensor histidine kinase [Campylobacter fetus subsp. testudinum]
MSELLTNNSETKHIQDGLKSLIEQTYLIEKEYKTLTTSYSNLQKFIQDIVESLGAALWVIDMDGKAVLKNAKADENEHILSLIDFKKTNQEVEFDSQFYAIKITQNDGNKIILATDISDEKRSARLVSMGAVAAHLSHEIRNPIGSISLLTSTLLKRADNKNRPLIEEIQKAIFRVERIIKATLLFTKGVYINKQVFNLEKLEQNCRTAINQYAFTKEIEFKFSGFNAQISGDIDLLDMVFSNFIFNAIDAIEEDESETGTVKIEHKFENNEHNFYISDSGVKIDKDIVFEPFKTTKLKGNGLGLALSIEIISAHKGSIALQNNPKEFTISLP